MDDLDMRPKVAKGIIGPCPVCKNTDFHHARCPIIPRDREIIHRNQEVRSKVETIHGLPAELSTLRAEGDRMKWLLGRIVADLPNKRDWLDPELEREAREFAALAPRGPEGEE